MKIRVATLLDIPQLVQFGAEFIKESPNYQGREYCHDQAAIHFTQLIKGAGVIFLAEHDGQMCGGFAGGIGSDWFNQQKVAYDYVMYVQPKFRKTRAAYMLIKSFIGWSRLMGAHRIQCGTTTGVESNACIKLYKHFGFNEYGTVLDMEL